MQLGNTIEMDGVTFHQSEALVLLQDSKSSLRIAIERALTEMVKLCLLDIHIHIFVYNYVGMHVQDFVCLHVRMYVCRYVSINE